MRIRLTTVALVAAVLGALTVGGTTLAHRGDHTAATAAKKGPLFAVLLGKNEISATGEKGAGDKDGEGSATVLLADADTVCFGITVSKIADPVAAHIHAAKKNRNGGVVVTLQAPSDGDPGASSGCVDGVESALMSSLRKHPERFYVNVHTADFPGGAIRGQLFHSSSKR